MNGNRMTFRNLEKIAHNHMLHAAKSGETPRSLIVTYATFQDLRSDVEFINSFHWAGMTSIPKEFSINGVHFEVEQFAGEKVVTL